MKFKDREAIKTWQGIIETNTDPYGARIVSYAKEWADLMEAQFPSKTLADVYESTSKEADTDGITGFMFGAAVTILYQVWAWGDELRVVHNAKHNYPPSQKGIVNPAIVEIGL